MLLVKTTTTSPKQNSASMKTGHRRSARITQKDSAASLSGHGQVGPIKRLGLLSLAFVLALGVACSAPSSAPEQSANVQVTQSDSTALLMTSELQTRLEEAGVSTLQAKTIANAALDEANGVLLASSLRTRAAVPESEALRIAAAIARGAMKGLGQAVVDAQIRANVAGVIASSPILSLKGRSDQATDEQIQTTIQAIANQSSAYLDEAGFSGEELDAALKAVSHSAAEALASSDLDHLQISLTMKSVTSGVASALGKAGVASDKVQSAMENLNEGAADAVKGFASSVPKFDFQSINKAMQNVVDGSVSGLIADQDDEIPANNSADLEEITALEAIRTRSTDQVSRKVSQYDLADVAKALKGVNRGIAKALSKYGISSAETVALLKTATQASVSSLSSASGKMDTSAMMSAIKSLTAGATSALIEAGLSATDMQNAVAEVNAGAVEGLRGIQENDQNFSSSLVNEALGNIVSGSLAAIQENTGIDEASIVSISKGVSKGATSALGNLGLTEAEIVEAFQETSKKSISALKDSGMSAQSIISASRQISAGATSSLAKSGVTVAKMDAAFKAINAGAVEGLKEVRDNVADFNSQSVTEAISGIVQGSIGALQENENLTSNQIAATSKQAAAGATSALQRAGVTVAELGAMVQATAKASVGALDEAGLSADQILQTTMSITDTTMQALAETGLDAVVVESMQADIKAGAIAGLADIDSSSLEGEWNEEDLALATQEIDSYDSTTYAASAVKPTQAALSINFQDNDAHRDRIAGVITIGKASNETSISRYVLYWGQSASDKLPTPLATVYKTGADLEYALPSTNIPLNATHILVFSANLSGEMTSGIALSIADNVDAIAPTARLIVDDISPTNVSPIAMGIEFSETVSGLALADFTLVNATLADLKGSGTSYSAVLFPIADGAVSAQLKAGAVQDQVGNGNVASNSVQFEYDASVPIVSIGVALMISINNQASYSINGSCSEEGQAVSLSLGSLSFESDCISGVFAMSDLDVSGLADGGLVVTADHRDLAGNRAISAKKDVVKDTQAPVAPAISGISAGAFNTDQTFTVTGAEGGGTLEYSLNDGSAWLVYSSAVTLSTDSANTVTARQTDGAGNISANAASIALTIDKTGPIAPTVVGIAAGSFNSDQIFSLSGSGEAGSQLAYSSDGGSTWSAYTSAVTLSAEGSYLITARETDAAGNGSASAESVLLTIDKTGPAAPTVVGISAGSFNSDQVFTLGGSGEAGSQLAYSSDGGSTWSAYTSAVTLSAEGSYSITARETDATGNGSVSAESVLLTIDKTGPAAPTVVGISAGSFNSDQVFTLSGSGEAGSQLAYSSDGGSTWSVYTSAVTLSAEGSYSVTAHETDVAGNVSASVAMITLSIDKTAPSAPSVTGISAGTFNTNQTFTVTGAEGGGTLEYSLNGGTAWTAYSGAVTLSTDSANTITARQTDAAGNISANATSITVTIDKTAPVAPTVVGIAAGSFNSDQIFSLSGSGEVGSQLAYSSDGGSTWSAYTSAVTLSAEGSYSITARETDAAGNGSVSAESVLLTIDKTGPAAPTVVGISAGSFNSDQVFTLSGSGEAGSQLAYSSDGGSTWSAYTSAVTLSAEGSYTVTARETDAAGNVSANAAMITLSIDKIAPPAPSITGISAGMFNANQTFTVTGAEGGGTLEYSLNDGSAWLVYSSAVSLSTESTNTITARQIDAAGNVSANAANINVIIDKTQPLVTLATTAPNPTNSSSFSVTITFNESVTGFILGDITVGNGTASNLAGGPAVYTTDITPSADGAVTVDVNAGVASDSAGNTNTAATQLSRIYDGTQPSVTLSTGAGNPTNSSPFSVTITFSESVTSFILGDITVGNGGASNLAGGPAVYTADITPSVDGAVTVDVSAGLASDNAGNTNTAAAQLNRTYDGTAPTVSIGAPSVSLINSSGTVDFTLSYEIAPSPVLTTGDITISPLGVTGCTVSGVNNSSPTAPVVTIGSCSGDGTFTISVASGQSQDAAGNADAGAGPSGGVTVDNTAPTVVIGSPTVSAINTSATVTFTLTYELIPSPALANGDITVNMTTVTGCTASVSNGGTLNPVVTVNGSSCSGEGSFTITVSAGKSQDTAGNFDNGAGPSASVIVDTTPATVSLTSTPVINNANKASYVVSGNCSENTRTVSVSIGGTVNSSPVCSGGTFTTTGQNVSAIADSASVSITADHTDAAGNNATQATTTVLKDTGNPTVAIGSTPVINDANKASYVVSGNCSENTRTVSVSIGGTVNSSPVCSGGTFTTTGQNVSAIADSASVSITADHTDAAGNNATQASTTILKDTGNPVAPGIPDMTSGTDTGSSNTDNITNNTTPSFTVSCESGATVQLFDTATPTGSSGVCASSTVILITGVLAPGGYSINAKQTDAAGNLSVASSGLSVTIDTSAPAAPGALDLQTASDTGSSTLDNITNDTTPTFDISCDTGTSVQLYTDGLASGSAGSCSASTVALTTAALGNGAFTITAKQTDAAGNLSVASSGLSVTIDTAAPAAPGAPDLQTASDTGSSSTDNVTGDTTPTFDLSCETGVSVRLYADGIVSGSAGSCSGSAVALTTATLGEGPITITAKQTDAAGNVSVASSGLSVTIDTNVPIISSVASSTPDGSYKSGDPIAIQVLFSETVNVTGTPQLTMETGVTDAVVDYSSGSGSNTLTFNYTVSAGHTSADLDYAGTTSLAFNAGTITDNAGNSATLTLVAPGANGSISFGSNIVIDTSAPTVTSVSVPSNAIYIAGENLDFTVNFDENITVAGTDSVLALTIGVTGQNASQFSTASNSITYRYTIQAGDTDADGIAVGSVTLNTTTIQDAALNNANITLNSVGSTASVLVDAVVPTVLSVTSSTPDGIYKSGDPIAIQIVFSEIVNVAGTPQLTLETGVTDAVVDYSSGSGSNTLTFNYTVSAGHTAADLDYVTTTSLAFNAGAIADNAGNSAALTLVAPGANGSISFGSNIVIDTAAPAVTVNQAGGQSDPVNSTPIQFTVVFSEAINPATFTSADITDNGTATGLVWDAPTTGDNITWTIQASTVASDGTVIPSIGASAVQDAAGNNNTASTSTDSSVTYDATQPTVGISSATPEPTNSSPFSVTITFNESVNNFIVSDITVGNGSAGSFSGSGTTYTADITPSGQGAVTVDVAGGVANDTAGNGNTVASQFSRTFDSVPPTVSSAETLDTDNNGMIDHYKITFDSQVNIASFPGHTTDNALGNVQTDWLVAGYSGVVLDRTDTLDTVDNDNIIYLKFNESGSPDTGAKPDLTTTASPALTDMAGNALVQIITATLVESDTAAPVIYSAKGTVGTTTLKIYFSEAVDTDNTAGCVSLLTAADFTYVDTAVGNAASLSGTVDDDACSDNKIILTTNANFVAGDIGVDAVRAASAETDSIFDAASNPVLNATQTIMGSTPQMVLHYKISAAGGDTTSAVYDQSGIGTGKDGTLTNGPVFASDYTGAYGQAYQFDGVNDYIEVASNADLQFASGTSITLAAWIKRKTLGAIHEIINKGRTGTETNTNFVFRCDDNDKLSLYFNNGGSWPQYISTNPVCRTTEWIHVALVYQFGQGTSMKAYLNGALISGSWVVGTGNESPPVSTAPLWVGAVYYSGSIKEKFNGSIDDIRIYRSALTAAEIKLLAAKVPDGLVAYYPLETDANDYSGNDLNAVAQGGVSNTTSDRFGKATNAYDFDGTDDYLTVADNNILDVSNVSISVWVKPTDINTNLAYTLVRKDGVPSSQGYLLQFEGNGTKLSMGIQTDQNQGTNTPISAADFTDGAWHHLVGTFDGSTIKVYKDGTLIGSKVNAGTIGATAEGLTIGHSKWGADNYAGAMSDVRIYNRALSANEVKALAVEPDRGLVAWYPLDGNANDLAGGNNGTVNGATLTPDRSGSANSAYSFNGTTDYIESTTNLGITGNQSRSISFWLQSANTVLATDGVIAHWGSTDYFGAWLWSATNTHSAAVDVSNYHTNIPVTLDWEHFVYNYNGSKLDVYKDGNLVYSTPLTSINTADSHLFIGRSAAGGAFLDGKLDDVRVYNRALTAAEVQSLGSDLDHGLVAHYPLNPLNDTANDTTVDATGNGHNLTIGSTTGADSNDPTSAVNRNGTSNAAYSFDGTDDYISKTASGVDLANKSITMAVWVKRPGPSGASNRLITYLGAHAVANQGLHWGITSSDTIFTTFWGVDLGSDVKIADTNWHHLAFTYDVSTQTRILYLDGSAIAQDGSVAAFTGGTDLTIGAYHPGNGGLFNGVINDLRIYDRPLTAGEIKTLAGDLNDGLVAWYPLDDNNGSTVRDASVYGNSGTVTGATPALDQNYKANGAYSFSGSDYILAPDANQNDLLGSYTISVWANFDSLPSDHHIISKWTPGQNYTFYTGSTGYLSYSTSTGGVGTGANVIGTNQWYHLTYVKLGTENMIYINGNMIYSAVAEVDGLTSGVDYLGIGSNSGGSQNIYGRLSDVRLYNRPLTVGEIRQISGFLPPQVSGLKLWLKADGGAFRDDGTCSNVTYTNKADCETNAATWTPQLAAAANNNAVAQWNDLSGIGLHASQATAGNKPLFIENALNGRPVVRFDGTDDYIQTASGAGLDIANPSIFVVSKITCNSGSIISKNFDNAGNTTLTDRRKLNLLGSAGGGIYSYYAGSDTEGYTIPWNGSQFNVVSVISFSDTNHDFSLDGTVNVKTSPATSLASYNTAPFMVGGAFTGVLENFCGDIAEIIIYDRALSAYERTQVQCYLSKKYSITISTSCQ